MTQASHPDDYAFYEAVAQSTSKNVTFSFLGLGITWALSKTWLFGAKALFWIGLVINGLNSVEVLFLTALGLYAFALGARESRWIWSANAVRLGEISLCGLVMWWSAGFVGYR